MFKVVCDICGQEEYHPNRGMAAATPRGWGELTRGTIPKTELVGPDCLAALDERRPVTKEELMQLLEEHDLLGEQDAR